MLATTDIQDSVSNDDYLLRRYVHEGDRKALAILVERYAPMVLGAARRQVNHFQMAEDVMQNVFVTFARRAAQIRSGAVLGVWLLQTTRYTAFNAMRTESRRNYHEAAAARPELSPQAGPLDAAIDAEHEQNMRAIGRWLDEAIARLARADQIAIVLRFFRGQSLRDVASALGTTEEAARKRVGRAIGRLRKRLISSGAPPEACGESALMACLSGPALAQVPASVVAHATAAASATKVAGISILHGVLTMTTTAKIVTGAAMAAVIFGGSVGLVRWAGVKFTDDSATVALHTASVPGISTPLPTTVAPKPIAVHADWNARFNAVYGLAPGQVVKFVPEPFIPEREEFLRQDSRIRRPRAPVMAGRLGFMPLAGRSNSIMVPGGIHGIIVTQPGPQSPADIVIEQQPDGSL
ncbi:MAG TPA: sigma-70 family RNA polymerase sigma factor, partial [Rhizomicrobium sp.]|nr:sigma-70 family RNA polymerase sigma factor [Rhizomicrobium sp.]